jgi:hypothetical protein
MRRIILIAVRYAGEQIVLSGTDSIIENRWLSTFKCIHISRLYDIYAAKKGIKKQTIAPFPCCQIVWYLTNIMT